MERLGTDCENSQKLCKNNTSETTGKGVMHKLRMNFGSIGQIPFAPLAGRCIAEKVQYFKTECNSKQQVLHAGIVESRCSFQHIA